MSGLRRRNNSENMPPFSGSRGRPGWSINDVIVLTNIRVGRTRSHGLSNGHTPSRWLVFHCVVEGMPWNTGHEVGGSP